MPIRIVRINADNTFEQLFLPYDSSYALAKYHYDEMEKAVGGKFDFAPFPVEMGKVVGFVKSRVTEKMPRNRLAEQFLKEAYELECFPGRCIYGDLVLLNTGNYDIGNRQWKGFKKYLEKLINSNLYCDPE